MWIFILQRLSFEFFWHILYFPVWWYSAGTLHAGRVCYGFFRDANNVLAPGLWIKNIFVPMFGQADWQGRIVSFFIRFVNIIVRTILLAAWSAVIASLFAAWLAAPIVVVGMLFMTGK